MAISVEELKQWINTLPNEVNIGVDEGGLVLRVEGDPNPYLEIGGLTDEDDDLFSNDV